MSFTVLIPARLASSRLPGKPLADIGGVPMIVRVARQALQSAASRVVVAADHPDIVHACVAHGIDSVPTRTDHATGSDRLAEASRLLELDDQQVVVNVQGDEPLIDPALIDACTATLSRQTDCVMATAAHPIDRGDDFHNPNVVKVVVDSAGRAIYFSRAPIPWPRDARGADGDPFSVEAPLRHIGLYAYRAGFLREFPRLAVSPLETVEALEQLRVLWHGHRIAVHLSATRPEPGVDTPDDLARVRALFTHQTAA